MEKLLSREFGNFIGELYEYFDKDGRPKNKRLELWYQKLKDRKSHEVKQAIEHIKDNSDRLPVNMPKAIKAAITATQGEKTVKHVDYGPCDGCNGTGIFKLRICTPDGYWHEPIAFCGDCENWRNWTNEPGQRVTNAELEWKNIKHKPYNKCLSYTDYRGTRAGTVKELQKLANDVTKDMEVA